MAQAAPIIVTATMGDADFAWADGLRRAHFPPERNVLSAHITLFHHLPPSVEDELVAYRIECPALAEMRRDLAEAFHGLLTPQDSAPPRLHVTIQNKVSPEESRALFTALKTAFQPRPFAISGLAAWWYRGGPWEAIRAYRFRG